MNLPLTIECPVHFRGRTAGSRQSVPGCEEHTRASSAPARVPRITRLMALALRFDELIRTGEVADYAELARLGRVSRARVTQVMNLLVLAPAIQEALLFLPSAQRGRDAIHLSQLQPIARMRDWRRQRRAYKQPGASPNTHAMTDPDPSDNAVLLIQIDGSAVSGSLFDLQGIPAGGAGLLPDGNRRRARNVGADLVPLNGHLARANHPLTARVMVNRSG